MWQGKLCAPSYDAPCWDANGNGRRNFSEFAAACGPAWRKAEPVCFEDVSQDTESKAAIPLWEATLENLLSIGTKMA
jgi:hypothetical protein